MPNTYLPRFANRANLAEALKTVSHCNSEELPETFNAMKSIPDGRVLIAGDDTSDGTKTPVIITIDPSGNVFVSRYIPAGKGLFSQAGGYSNPEPLGCPVQTPARLFGRLSTLEGPAEAPSQDAK